MRNRRDASERFSHPGKHSSYEMLAHKWRRLYWQIKAFEKLAMGVNVFESQTVAHEGGFRHNSGRFVSLDVYKQPKIWTVINGSKNRYR